MDKILKLINKIKEFEDIDEFIDAKAIKTSSIVTAFWVRFKCKYACGNYNTTLDCPPYSPGPEEMSELLKCYDDAILIKCSNHEAPSKIAINLEKIAIGMEFYKAISFGAGSCKHCVKCNLKSCINRSITRPSMEACGIDVVQTAKNNGYNMVDKKDKTLYFFGLVLLK
ncbi:MAG: DUF2284 domain-containing protein [Methanobrevibacter sp.]|jgi:predicted metal-binding protein|nr:DUF2284 domain-containing protein [Methanobrevibacter sp.]